jgi:serine/threonine-protein kinase
MKPEQWDQAKALFSSLIERDPASWPELLASEPDPAIVAQVQRLLAAHVTNSQPLRESAQDTLLGSDALLGQCLGPFRLDALLGEGGGGRVYLAERTDVGGRAAVKILRGRFASAEARRRFQAEQAILARLDHPNIARLLQVGITDDGTPWLAMEYVEGRPFAAHVATLPVGDRLRMVIRLLHAVDYAHRQLVVHRDIKPGNILVDPRGEPRLLDFGIAKRLDEAGATQTQFQPRTPAYAAPEQVLGEPISVATDVYAMGVLLYEALSGHHPWTGSGRSLDEAILGGEPALPSSRLAGPARRRLQGDLDAIVLQAMQRDPARRYPGAAAMAEDLQRHLERRPVRAQKQTWLYRSQRFLARNHRPVAAVTVLVTLLAVGWARESQLRADKALEAEKATQVAGFMLDVFAAGDSQSAGYNMTKESTLMDLLARGTARLETLESAPLARADLAQRIGEVYWGHSEYGAAERLFQSAIALRQAHRGDPTDTAQSWLMLGRVYERLSRYAEMLVAMQTAYELRLRALGPDHPATIHSLHRVGAANYHLQHLDRADAIARQAIEAWRAHLPAHNLDLANSLNIHSLSQLRMGGFQASLEAQDEARRLRLEVLPADHNLIAEAFTNRSRSEFAMGRADAALASLRQSLAINERHYTSDHWDLVLQYEKLVPYLVATGGIDEAAQVAERALAMARRLHEGTHNPELVDLARHAQVVVLRAQGQLAPALALAREVLASRQGHLPPLHSNILATRSLVAELLRETGEPDRLHPGAGPGDEELCRGGPVRLAGRPLARRRHTGHGAGAGTRPPGLQLSAVRCRRRPSRCVWRSSAARR